MHQVVIVGAGPVGLCAALSLADQGIRSVVVEKHPTTTHHPKARGVNTRTMELFRLWGVEEQMKQHQMPREAHRFTWIEDFQGKEITRVQSTLDLSKVSPTDRAIISQDYVETELYKKARTIPLIQLRFNTEMLAASQDKDKVTVEILDKKTNQKESLIAQYLIAADGANSPLRKLFRVEMEGIENLGSFCNIFCEMNLDKYVANRRSAGFMFTRPDVRGTFLLANSDNRGWLVGVRLDPSRQLTEETFTNHYCVEHVKKLIGDQEIEVRVINKAFWTMAALIAKQYRVGRVFFAGDAAHRLPPTGGLGMNTGIQDAHNLAWKLARVINKQSDDSLLDTYFTERVQVARTNTDWSLTNSKRFVTIFTALANNDIPEFEEALKDQDKHINNILLDLGFIYGKEYQLQQEYKPSAEEGARAPHCWLAKENKRISTLDLFHNQFVLMCSPEASYWHEKFRQHPCQIVTIGNHGDYRDVYNDFFENYGISNQGAVLVRPDGHVAWRSFDQRAEMPKFE